MPINFNRPSRVFYGLKRGEFKDEKLVFNIRPFLYYLALTEILTSFKVYYTHNREVA